MWGGGVAARRHQRHQWQPPQLTPPHKITLTHQVLVCRAVQRVTSVPPDLANSYTLILPLSPQLRLNPTTNANPTDSHPLGGAARHQRAAQISQPAAHPVKPGGCRLAAVRRRFQGRQQPQRTGVCFFCVRGVVHDTWGLQTGSCLKEDFKAVSSLSTQVCCCLATACCCLFRRQCSLRLPLVTSGSTPPGLARSHTEKHLMPHPPNLQMRMVPGDFWIDPAGPYKSLEDLWDGE